MPERSALTLRKRKETTLLRVSIALDAEGTKARVGKATRSLERLSNVLKHGVHNRVAESVREPLVAVLQVLTESLCESSLAHFPLRMRYEWLFKSVHHRQGRTEYGGRY